MADTFTPNFDFVLPEIGGSPDTWGNKLNENFSQLDNLVVPSGLIAMWSGSVANIPAGWALCDGSSGTPDLRGRFIIGAGDGYSVGDTGGVESVTLETSQIPAHNHSASTGSNGSHNHTMNGAGAHSHTSGSAGGHSHSMYHTAGGYETSNGLRTRVLNTGNAQGGTLAIYRGQANGDGPNEAFGVRAVGGHTHSISNQSNHTHTINSNGAHTHSVSVGNTGGGEAHENRPPYYALAYIMRLAP